MTKDPNLHPSPNSRRGKSTACIPSWSDHSLVRTGGPPAAGRGGTRRHRRRLGGRGGRGSFRERTRVSKSRESLTRVGRTRGRRDSCRVWDGRGPSQVGREGRSSRFRGVPSAAGRGPGRGGMESITAAHVHRRDHDGPDGGSSSMCKKVSAAGQWTFPWSTPAPAARGGPPPQERRGRRERP